MAPMFVIIGAAVVVQGIAGGRIAGVDQRHVTFAALNRSSRIAFMVPVASRPIVVLVLQLHPPDAVDFLINKLLVTGGTVFGFLVHALAQSIVLGGPGPDQKVARHRPYGVIRTPLPEIFLWL